MTSSELYVMFLRHREGAPFREFSQWFNKNFFSNEDIPYNMEFLSEFIFKQTFSNREQYMMVYKALIFEDFDIADKILHTSDPKIIKALGRNVRNYDEETWGKYKYKIVVNGNYLQFSQDAHMKEILLNTDNKIIIEASPYDRVWGIGYSEKNALLNKDNWGQNLLGKALMEVRSIL